MAGLERMTMEGWGADWSVMAGGEVIGWVWIGADRKGVERRGWAGLDWSGTERIGTKRTGGAGGDRIG